jgi:hypothetical protein
MTKKDRKGTKPDWWMEGILYSEMHTPTLFKNNNPFQPSTGPIMTHFTWGLLWFLRKEVSSCHKGSEINTIQLRLWQGRWCNQYEWQSKFDLYSSGNDKHCHRRVLITHIIYTIFLLREITRQFRKQDLNSRSLKLVTVNWTKTKRK